jgi:hypothetical protein
VVITTLTTPAAWAAVTADIVVGLSTVNVLAAVPPKVTEVAPVKPVPVIVTAVPPLEDPVAGEIPENVGANAYE